MQGTVGIAESQHIIILHPCDVKIKVSLCAFDTPSLPVSIGLAGYIMAGAAVQTVIQLLAQFWECLLFDGSHTDICS